MDATIRSKAEAWLNSNIDQTTKTDIEKMLAGDGKELTEAFYKDLEFGTGGLRGIMGTGTNRVNKYTIGMATQGLANYLIKTYPNEQIKIVIAHDSRNKSKELTDVTASVFSANGIEVYKFPELRPTPQLSFAVRELGCHSGIMLTASHNPKEYNGYKAYWNDGAQMVAPHDTNTIDEVSKITSINEVKFEKNESLIHTLGEDMDEKFLNKVVGLQLSKDVVARQKDLKIVYSPLHGTGITLTPEALKRFGFENVIVVEEQAKPDGNFPTVVYPNPEEQEAMKLSLLKAVEVDADLIMAQDPDADRVGIGVKNLKGEFVLLNGNQTGSLLIYYLLERWKAAGKLDGKQYIVKTIVTTELIKAIADAYDVRCYDTLTGFKHIAAVIKEQEGKTKFIGGGEESYGYLIDDFVRDKDAIGAAAMIAEMAAYAKDQGKSVYELMIDMYVKFGYYKEKLISVTKQGKAGAEEIVAMMKQMRQDTPSEFAGEKVATLIDYQSLERKELSSGKVERIDYPKSNVLQFLTEAGSKISARPSGTEPKIKFYISVQGKLDNAGDFEAVSQKLDQRIEALANAFS